MSLEGGLPPDHYLTCRPKIARCEACQEAKMYHRQRRRSSGESRAVRHNAKVPDAITMGHIESDGELGISLSGNSVAVVARDIATECLPRRFEIYRGSGVFTTPKHHVVHRESRVRR